MPKLFSPKKCLNYDKSEFSTNRVKGPKDQNSDKKRPRSNIKFHYVPGNAKKKREKLRHYSLSWQNSVKFCKNFTRDRIFLHQHCWHVCTFLHLWGTGSLGWPVLVESLVNSLHLLIPPLCTVVGKDTDWCLGKPAFFPGPAKCL